MNLNLGMADSIIVATAKAYDAQIVTSDKHLRKVEKVKFIDKQDNTRTPST
jgi:predicted nucleic acid-binding protein